MLENRAAVGALALAVQLALCGAAGLASGEEPEANLADAAQAAQPAKAKPITAPSIARTDPILSRLGLSDAQVKAIDGLVEDCQVRQRDLQKEKLSARARAARTAELQAKLKQDIRATLTAAQGAAYDAGQKLVKDYAARFEAASRSLQQALKEAGRDTQKLRSVREAHNEEVRKLRDEQTRQLDEKVGKVAPPKPAPGPKPAEAKPADPKPVPPTTKEGPARQ
jgi:hypothetical protein